MISLPVLTIMIKSTLLYYVIYVISFVAGPTPTNLPVWDHAWYDMEVRREIKRLGYDPENCCNSTWQSYVNESRLNDEDYVKAIEELCRRYCLPDDAERLEAKRTHIAKLGIPSKEALDYLMKQIVNKLAESDPIKEVILSHWYFRIPPLNTACYWKVYYCFSDHCVDIRFDERIKKYRGIFAWSCTCGWLNYEKTCKIMEKTCRALDIYQSHPKAFMQNETEIHKL